MRAMAKHHRELEVWQLCDALRSRWIELTKREGLSRDFDFRDQTNRAARSACRNVAEGFWKFDHTEFARYLNIVKGSVGELFDSADEALQKGFISKQEYESLNAQTDTVMRATNGLREYLLSTPTPKRRRRPRTSPSAPDT